MADAPKALAATPTLPVLARSRNLRNLWLLRVLLQEGALSSLLHDGKRHAAALLASLQVSSQGMGDDEGRNRIEAELRAAHGRLEANKHRLRHSATLQANLRLLRNSYGFSATETKLFALAVLLATDEEFALVAEHAAKRVNLHRQLATVVGETVSSIGRVMDYISRLRRSRLVSFGVRGSLCDRISLSCGPMRKFATRRMASVDEVFADFAAPSPQPRLVATDYLHLEPSLGAMKRLLCHALDARRAGCNVLLYGTPGTGKSELSRLLAKMIEVPIYQVASDLEIIYPPRGNERLRVCATAQFLLAPRRALLCFDEVDIVFRARGFCEPSPAESDKESVNDMLETNPIPTIWIANSIAGMDPAFARRFDLIVRLDPPPQAQRLRLLERECSDLVAPELLQRLSRVEHITPGVVARVASTVRCMGDSKSDNSRLLESVLSGTLKAQRLPPLRRSLADQPGVEFDPALCNASEDLATLANGVAGAQAGRICLYGPPGTGKTAFGHWLAQQVGRPFLARKISDLQSPWVGEFERNLAEAFDQASREQAVFQIDEVDSYLRDRRQTQRGWEANQVNEFLVQLESFEGIFVASTNLMDCVDPAALRRFDHKIRMDFLRQDQAAVLFARLLAEFGLTERSDAVPTHGLDRLTPGDFAVVRRRHRISPYAAPGDVIETLHRERSARGEDSRRIGFL